MLGNNRGMTLIEIVIVVAIIASLMGFLGKKVFDNFQKAQMKQARIQMGEISGALTTYYTDCYKFPTESEGLEALVNEQAANCTNWGPSSYVTKSALKDPWGNDFLYESDGSSFTLISLGADGREGGSGVNRDISSDDE